ncbi:hypothetical protein KQ693_10325 [Thermus sp. PS18]|uniref:hypothetical protein n=1 Tax=Thermus sp. PS18 TaxID=2849039 RepID=UPI002263AF10|nr:hypothetical protein [Thermus sp. PS18]UZX15011.1 hypothetical protein KQ693_10325 [Thermus sp. PS18]
MDERDLELEILSGVLEELSRLGAPEERLRPLRERLWALRLFRALPQSPPPVWGRPIFWTVLALLLALLGALLGLPVHKLFP